MLSSGPEHTKYTRLRRRSQGLSPVDSRADCLFLLPGPNYRKHPAGLPHHWLSEFDNCMRTMFRPCCHSGSNSCDLTGNDPKPERRFCSMGSRKTDSHRHFRYNSTTLDLRPSWRNCTESNYDPGNRKSGPSSASSYEISAQSFPKGSSRDSYEIVLPRYPGSSAPGYSGFPQQQYQQPQFDDRQPAYQSGQYNQGQQTSQNSDPRYMQHSAGGAYSSAPAYQGGAYAAETPYVNVGAHSHHQAPAQAPSDRSGGYPAASYATGPAYGAPPHDPRYGYAQPVDPHYGRSNSQYPATTQADYSSVPSVNTYGYDYQTAPQTQAPAQPPTPSAHAAVTHAAVQDPRATTSSPVGTQAQTGYSAPSSSSSRHRDRGDRDHRDSRHSRR